jgi:hypothetical protein
LRLLTVPATNNEDNDLFAFVMIDGDPDAYNETLVNQWTFLTDAEQLAKHQLRHHE